MKTRRETKSDPRKQLGLRVHPVLRRELKKAAADADVSMEDKLQEILAAALGVRELSPSSRRRPQPSGA